jgi:anti-sigma factor RsiW
MTHPEELLAGYVDGSLRQAERATVDEHLTGCGLCRGEVQMAGQARAKLGALLEQPAPAEISVAVTRALAQASPSAGAGSRVSVRYRVVTVLAAAAVVALLAVALPHLGGSNRSTSQLAAGDALAPSTKQTAPEQASAGTIRIEIQGIDYTAATAAKLAVRGPTAPVPVASGTANGGYSSAALGTASASQTALSCLQKAFQGIPGTPIRLISASFQGQPAYIGVYTEGPGAGLAPDTVTVRVASASSCTILTFTSSKI